MHNTKYKIQLLKIIWVCISGRDEKIQGVSVGSHNGPDHYPGQDHEDEDGDDHDDGDDEEGDDHDDCDDEDAVVTGQITIPVTIVTSLHFVKT